MKIFFIDILVFLFQLKTIIEKKDKETQNRNFHQSIGMLSKRKTSYLKTLFWKNKPQKSNSKWPSAAVTRQYYGLSQKLLLLLLLFWQGQGVLFCFVFINSQASFVTSVDSETLQHRDSWGLAHLHQISHLAQKFLLLPTLCPLPVPQAGRQFRSFRACGTPGHKGQAGGAEDISKAFQLLPRAFNINDK